jgi:hypothetical protein
MKKVLSLSFILVLIIGILSDCKKDNGDAPVLPPEGSMVIDFRNFESGKKSADMISELKGVNNSTWEFSALVAGYWRAIINTTLAIPVASFKLAIDNDPVYIEDKTWQWSYNASIVINQVNVTYKARLTGQIRETDVLWKMYIAKEGAGAFTEFTWFEGTSKLDGTGGQWILNHSSQYPEPVLKIDWTSSGSAVGSVKYTYVRALNNNRVTDTFKDSTIEYGTKSTALNAYYTIHYFNGLSFSDVNVEWNTTSHNGRVQCSAYFGNTNWYCWDSNLLNIQCQL